MPKPRNKPPTKPARPKRAKPAATKREKPRPKQALGEWAANAPYDRACALLHADPLEAVKQFKAAAKLQPARARIHINLSWALSTLGQHTDAIAAATKAHALDPRDAYIAARRVHVLFAAGDKTVIDAARHAMELPDIDPDDRRYAHSAICWTLMRTAPTAAVRETELLVAESPDNGEALAAHGCALAAACRWDDGIPWLDKAIAAAPDDARIPGRRAQIIEARDVAEALMTKLRDQVQRDPQDAKRWRELGLGLARFARLDEALIAFERARQLDPGDGKRHDPLVTAALMVEATARSYVAIGDLSPIG
jgi:tetratricopeptide (TPR) repeat protein